MRVSSLALVAALALAGETRSAAQQFTGPSYQFPNYDVSFSPGGADASDNHLGGTELRDLVAFKGKLYAGVGYWMDQGPGAYNAQILVLDSADGQWRQDVNFGDFCPPDNARCTLATGAISSLRFNRDKDGAAVNNVDILTASIWPAGKAPAGGNWIRVYAKNNTDDKWYETQIAQTTGNAQARSFGRHVDAVTGESLAFVAGGAIGIYHGWLATKRGAGKNPLVWVTGADQAEFNLATAGADQCGGGPRIMAFAEAAGSLFATKCFRVFKRTDGPQADCKPDEVKPEGKACEQRWNLFWQAPGNPSSQSGFRGMTQVTESGAQQLLLGWEGSGTAYIYRLDPASGAATIELNVTATLAAEWQMPIGYIITSYSSPMPGWTDTGGLKRVIGFEAFAGKDLAAPPAGHTFAQFDTGGRMEGEGWYFLRQAASAYRLYKLPPIIQGRELAVRAAATSPFADDCDANGRNCAIYFGGFDANSAKTVQSCYAPPCDALPAVPVHDTAWIVKGHF